MTIVGPDISSYQDGLDVAHLDHPFVIAKCTEGTYYVDQDYNTWRSQAQASGKLFIAYHFISGENPTAQARALAAHIGDTRIPVMLDWEPTSNYRPDLIQLIAVADAMHTAGLRVVLAYAPHWHWESIGSPSLTSLRIRGISLVSSAYPGGSDYPGDDAPGWQPYGGLTPLLYQYTASAPIAGRAVDMNAYRGSIDQLRAALGLPTPTSEGTLVPTIPDSIAHHFPDMDLSGDFPPNGPFTVEQAAIWADARAEAAYRQAVANGTKLDQLLARAAIDVDALAAALAPKIEGGTQSGMPADQLADLCAHAAVVHLNDILGAGLKAGGA